MSKQIYSLAMLHVDQQHPRRFSMNASYAQAASTAQIDTTCHLFARVQSLILGRGIDHIAVPTLDALHPVSLAERLRTQIGTFDELRDPGLDSQQQDTCFSAIHALHAEVASDLARRSAAQAQSVIAAEVAHVRAALLPLYAAAPQAVGEIAAGIRTALDRTRVPDPNWKPFERWAVLKKLDDKLRQRRSTLPPATLKTLQDALAGEARDLYQQSLLALAVERIAAAWPPAKAEALTVLGDFCKRGAEVAASLSAVRKSLARTQAAVAAEQAVTRASVVLILPGPTPEQVLAGILSQLQAPDEAAATRLLLDAWEARLREICPTVCAWIERTAPLPELIRGMSAEVQAAAFCAIVEESLGPGQSLYEIIKRQGIKDCAEYLYRRSEPTVHLSGRDISELGLSPKHSCIVTLPRSAGPKDNEIRSDLVEAFEKIDRDCTFVDAPPTDRTVTVTRLLDGFVIGIEGQNPMLLDHYQSAAAKGHRPHLFGLLPDSPDGRATEQYLCLDPQSPTLRKENDDDR